MFILLLFGVVLGQKRREISLREDASLDTILLNLNDEFFKNSKILRRFSVQQLATGNLVKVDGDGNVRLATEIDHEKLCSNSECHFTHTVRKTLRGKIL